MVKRSTFAPSPLSPTAWPADGFIWWRSLLSVILLALGLLVAGGLQLVWLLVSGARPDLHHLRLDWTLVALQVLTYDPAECPLCAQGVPVVKPGSRPG